MEDINNKTRRKQVAQNQPSSHEQDSVKYREPEDFKVALYHDNSDITVLTDEGEFETRSSDKCHLEFSIVRMGREKSFLKDLDVDIVLIDRKGEKFGPFEMEFLCNPLNHHYGADIDLPEGIYTAKVSIKPRSQADKHQPEAKEIVFEDVEI